MTVYWEADGIRLYLGDCREITDWLDADVLVTDPPYGMAFTAGKRVRSKSTRERVNTGGQEWTSRWTDVPVAGDGDTSIRDTALEMWGDKPALMFGTWKAPMPKGVREVLVWDKVVSTGMGALDIPWRPSWESIYVIGKGFTGSRSHGVIQCSLPTLAPDRKWHPTPKPVPLVASLIDKCPPGVIADPFAGAGSTLVAAKMQGRRAIGVELEEKFCEAAARRLDQGVLDFGSSA